MHGGADIIPDILLGKYASKHIPDNFSLTSPSQFRPCQLRVIVHGLLVHLASLYLGAASIFRGWVRGGM